MKFLKWIVVIRCDNAKFILPYTHGCYLAALKQLEDGIVPVFLAADPVLYPLRSARFLARELRRAGYNVRPLPFLIVQLRAWLQSCKEARKLNPWKK